MQSDVAALHELSLDSGREVYACALVGRHALRRLGVELEFDALALEDAVAEAPALLAGLEVRERQLYTFTRLKAARQLTAQVRPRSVF